MKFTFNLVLSACLFASTLADSSKQCVAQCSASKGDSNVSCLARCLGLPNPSPDQANATNDCNTKCTDSGDGSDTCFNNCIKSIFSNNDLNSASLSPNKATTITDNVSKTQDQSSQQTDSNSTKDKSSDKASSSKTSDKSSSTDKVNSKDSSKDTDTNKPNSKANVSSTLKSYVTKSTNGIANVDSNAKMISLSFSAALALLILPNIF